MITAISKQSTYKLMKNFVVGVLVLYSLIISIAYLREQPKTLVISVEENGSYIVKENTKAQQKAEKVRFVKSFIKHLYNYDETNYEDRTVTIGDMLDKDLILKKKDEFKQIAEKIKSEPVIVKGVIDRDEIREIDETHYEADVKVTVNRRLQKVDQLYRINIDLKEASRSENNPYPFEVTNYVEQINQ